MKYSHQYRVHEQKAFSTGTYDIMHYMSQRGGIPRPLFTSAHCKYDRACSIVPISLGLRGLFWYSCETPTSVALSSVDVALRSTDYREYELYFSGPSQ